MRFPRSQQTCFSVLPKEPQGPPSSTSPHPKPPPPTPTMQDGAAIPHPHPQSTESARLSRPEACSIEELL